MWQPLRRRGLGLTQLMIVTIGLSLALQYTFQYFVGARTVRVVAGQPDGPRPSARSRSPTSRWSRWRISIVVLAAVGYALLRTRIGRATRAVSDNPALAAASGIDVDKVIRLVWTVAMAPGRPLRPPLRAGHQRHQVGLRPADPAAALRRGHARRPRHRVRRAGRLPHHRPRGRALPGAGHAR